MTKLTSRDLIGALIDLEEEKEWLEMQFDPDNDTHDVHGAIVKVDANIQQIRGEIGRKIDSIDYFVVEMNRQSSVIDSEISVMNDEIKRLRAKKNAIKRSNEYLNKTIIPMIIETAGNDGVFKTDTTRYSMYETWGPLEVTDEGMIPDEYKRAKIEVDKKGARKAVIEATENNLGIAGFSIEKVKRVRRS